MVRLRFGCLFSDRIEALLDGRVAIDGFDLDLRITEAQHLFRQVLREAAFDVAELSMASHIAAVGGGARDHVGLPVFLSRSFRHGNLYVRTDRIARPEDLAGSRIGLIDWQQTAALWVRGLLADRHGVSREGVDWVAGGLHHPVTDDRTALRLPPTIRLRRTTATLDALLREGALDAVISPTAPRCFTDPAVPVARLWPDSVAAEAAYWRDTGLFPIMHLAVVRRSLAEAYPTLPARLVDAFEQARRLAIADRDARDFPKLIVPWLPAHAARTAERLGAEPWTYGVDANRSTLDAMLRYARSDGLAPPALTVENLFF